MGPRYQQSFNRVYNLSIVIWDFIAVSGKVNRFYLNQLVLTLTFPCNFFRLAKLKNKKYDAPSSGFAGTRQKIPDLYH